MVSAGSTIEKKLVVYHAYDDRIPGLMYSEYLVPGTVPGTVTMIGTGPGLATLVGLQYLVGPCCLPGLFANISGSSP